MYSLSFVVFPYPQGFCLLALEREAQWGWGESFPSVTHLLISAYYYTDDVQLSGKQSRIFII